MHIITLITDITDGVEVRKILEHIGVDSEAPSIAAARGRERIRFFWGGGPAPGVPGVTESALSDRVF